MGQLERFREISFSLNGHPASVRTDPSRPLLTVLREELHLTGTKQSCDMEGECGACTVIVDGEAQRSCLLLIGEVAGRDVWTVEGLGARDRPHPLQVAFLQAGAVQCGYCTPGMLMSAKALLDREPAPTRQQIIEALAGNLCRCTGYARIVDAVLLAAARMREVGAVHPSLTVRVRDEPPLRTVGVGDEPPQHGGWERVSGEALYAGDIEMPGLCHVAVVRSPHFHARVARLDITDARKLPGVLYVLTSADIPGENSLGGYSVDEHLLAPEGGTVRMRGDAVALVIAASAEAATEAAGSVRVDYDPLPHALTARDALSAAVPPIHAQGKVLAEAHIRTGDADAALGGADIIIEAHYQTDAQAHMAMERETVLAYVEGEGLTVVGGSHEPHWARGYLARILDLSAESIRVITPPIGGSFGARQDVTPLALAALAAVRTRKPVRLAYSRREVMEAASKRHAYDLHYTIGAGFGADGVPRLAALRAAMQANTGAYDSGGRYIAEYAVTASVGAYRWEAVEVVASVVYTNATKAGQFRGFGTPQPVLALECVLDELCERTGADPLAFRLRNALEPGEPLGLGYPPGETLGYRECLLALEGDYREMQRRAATFNREQKGSHLRRGVGLAGMMYRFGKFGAPRSQAEAALEMDGRLVVYASAVDYGQGIETTFVRLAARTFGVEEEAVRLVNADTARTLDGDVAGASRATYWVGSAVLDACNRLHRSLLDAAAEILDMAPDSLRIRPDGTAVEEIGRPERRIALAVLAEEMRSVGHPLRVTGRFDLTSERDSMAKGDYMPLFLTGAHAAEVEVDLDTGKATCLCVAAAHDVGHVVNRRDAVGQVVGGVVMGVGSALMEAYVPGETLGFASYPIPTARTVPEVRVHLVEVAGRLAPYGVKGLGEATFLPTPPAILNAISRAIGARIRRTPATAERVLEALAAR